MRFLVLLPALIHLYIFVLESLLWGKARTNQVFGLKPSDVEATRPLAFNQGVYNLLLAVAVGGGWCFSVGLPAFPQGVIVGTVLMVYGLGSIAVAGLTLLISSVRLWRSALIQLVPAVLGLVAVFLP